MTELSFGGDVAQNDTFPKHIARPLSVGLLVVGLAVVGLGLWAAFVPLATSIPTTGHLNAARPSYDVQHPLGGKIAQVLVARHDRVAKGQVLLRLDVSAAVAEQHALQDTLAPLVEERGAVRALLRDRLPNAQSGPEITQAAQFALRRLRTMQDTMDVRAQISENLQDSLHQRVTQLQESVARREEQRQSMQARHSRYATLADRGAFRASEADALAEDIFELEAAIARDVAEISDLRNQSTQAAMQATRDQLEFRQQILERLAHLDETIPQLRLQIVRLEAQIAQAEIVAPDDGIVAELRYDTDAMVIARGDTVLTLARPNGRPEVSFLVDPQSIDQLRVGMQGWLTVTALPQRNHPRVHATIRALSPEARRDSNGVIVGFDGAATIAPEDHQALLDQLGDEAVLSSDMPVSLVFTGRKVTFGDYLARPFLEFLHKAMQD